MAVLGNRAKETTTTSGLGTYSLDGPAAGFQSLASAAGKTTGAGSPWAAVRYVVCDDADFEVGEGTITAGSPDTLTRDVIKDSSLGGTAINWGTNVKNVFIALSAESLNQLLDNAMGNGFLKRTGADQYAVIPDPLPVVNGGTGLTTGAPAPFGAISGQLVRTSNNVVSLQPVYGTSVAVEVDGLQPTNSGALGFDLTSDIEAGQTNDVDTWYYLYVSGTTALTAHLSKTAPDRPGGTKPRYHPGTGGGSNTWACIGAWRTDSLGNDWCLGSWSGGWFTPDQHEAWWLHTLAKQATALAWQSVTLDTPETAERIQLLLHIFELEEEYYVFGPSDAPGTLPADAADRTLATANMQGVVAWRGATSNAGMLDDSHALPLPPMKIADPTSPAFRYGIVLGSGTPSAAAVAEARVVRYFDALAPRY